MGQWTKKEEQLLAKLDTPRKIQDFLDSIAYNSDDNCISPKRVMRERKAHCFEGALFAAACFAYHGQKPLLIDMQAENDYDHVIAPFKVHGYWGAVSKSNTTVLRYREPVYESVRELVMSYFDFFFNKVGEKTLRSYSDPYNLYRVKDEWMTATQDLCHLGDRLDKLPHYPIVKGDFREHLSNANELLIRAAHIGADKKGFYKV